jgi:hypothetical protein
LLGGATLERYLLPAMPILYAAVAIAIPVFSPPVRILAPASLTAGLISCLFWNPPLWPFPYENNLAMVDFVRLHRVAAQHLEANFKGRTITTVWPLTDGLRKPDFGYVSESFRVRSLPEFGSKAMTVAQERGVDVLVLYSREWRPEGSLLALGPIAAFRTRYFGYDKPISPPEWADKLGLVSEGRWERGGQWIEILAKPRTREVVSLIDASNGLLTSP